MKKKNPFSRMGGLVLALILAVTLLLVSCSSSPTTTAPDATSAPTTTVQTTVAQATTTVPASGGQITIGAINSLTGINVMTGAEQKWAYEQAVEDINAAGGLEVGGKKMIIKLVFEDDQSTSDGAASAMEKLIKIDGASLILSTNITPLNEAAATVAEKYKVYFAISTSWADEIQKQHYQWASDMFFTSTGAAETPFLIWNAQPADQRPSKVAVLMEDNSDGQGFGQGFVAAAKKYNYNIVDMDAYTPGTKDFSSNILKMKSTGADSLLWLGSPPDGITMIQQIKAANLNLKYIHGWKGFWDNQFKDALGKDSNYLVHDGFWAETLPYPGSKELGQKFKDDHNGMDSVSVGLSYASVQVLTQAIVKAGSTDPAKVRDAVFGGTFKGTTMGDVTFGSDGIWIEQPLALQWMDGKRIPIWPPVEGYQLQWMPPWNQR